MDFRQYDDLELKRQLGAPGFERSRKNKFKLLMFRNYYHSKESHIENLYRYKILEALVIYGDLDVEKLQDSVYLLFRSKQWTYLLSSSINFTREYIYLQRVKYIIFDGVKTSITDEGLSVFHSGSLRSMYMQSLYSHSNRKLALNSILIALVIASVSVILTLFQQVCK